MSVSVAGMQLKLFAEPLRARDAALYYATNRCLFASPTEEEAAAAALFRRLG